MALDKIIYRQGRRKNKKNPDGYEYMVNDKMFSSKEKAYSYGQKLIDDSKKVRTFNKKTGTYKTYNNQQDLDDFKASKVAEADKKIDDDIAEKNAKRKGAVLTDDGYTKTFDTNNDFKKYLSKEDKKKQKKITSDPTKGMTVAQKALYRQGGTEEQFAKLDSTNLAKYLPEFKTVEMKAEETEKKKPKKASEIQKELTNLKLELAISKTQNPELTAGIQAEINDLTSSFPVSPNIVPEKVKDDPVGPDLLHEWWGKRAEKAKILGDTRSKFEQQILNDETFKSQMPEKYQVNGLNAYKYWARDLADTEISDTERREKNEKDPLNLGI